MTQWNMMSRSLTETLGLSSAPIAITFLDSERSAPPEVPAFDRPMSEPTEDGRSGRVPASCVFWMEAGEGPFSTVARDHGNCSVGRWVHGFAALDDIVGASDVAALFESGWVTNEDVGRIEVIDTEYDGIVYGPLGEAPVEPDVVVLRLNPRQMMELADAVPNLELSGKPQCQIVAKAKAGQAAASMGCALSRERTGMSEGELTFALPASELPVVVQRLQEVVTADNAVQGYARDELPRFSRA